MDRFHMDKWFRTHSGLQRYSKRKNLSRLPTHLGHDVHGRNTGSPTLHAASRGVSRAELWILHHGTTPGHDMLRILDWDDFAGGCSDVEASEDHDEWEGSGGRV